MIGFEVYLESLVASWEAMAVPHPGARVIRGLGFVAARFPTQPIFDNAVLLDPGTLATIQSIYVGLDRYAVWTHTEGAGDAVRAAGFIPDEVTYPMVCELSRLPRADPGSRSAPTIIGGVDVAVITDLNGVGADLLHGVPRVRTYATAELTACAVLIEVSSDVNVSFVATRPDFRRRGLAAAVLDRALREARADGFVTSSLQATAMARGVYSRLGYRQVATWQEWVPPSRSTRQG